MDLAALELLAGVVKHGSFAAAARDLGVDPSSVSRSIATLEDELGLRLFQRSTRQLALTEAGSLYVERVQPLLGELRQAHLAAADVSAQPKGRLRVTASNSFGLRCVVPALPSLAVRCPQLQVELLMTDAVVDLVAERIDIAVRLGPLADSSLVAQPLVRTAYRVCASPGYLARAGRPKQPRNMADHACLLFPLAGFRSRWIFRDHKGTLAEVPVSGSLHASNALALQHCAVAGMGIALLPGWLVADDIAAGRLVDLFPRHEVTATDFNTAAWFVYPSRAYVPLKVRAFMAHLRQHLGAQAT
ncbi:MAG: LysR family transcriptional regulator [Rhizobacter sp.]